jgi:hypothetical protein
MQLLVGTDVGSVRCRFPPTYQTCKSGAGTWLVRRGWAVCVLRCHVDAPWRRLLWALAQIALYPGSDAA